METLAGGVSSSAAALPMNRSRARRKTPANTQSIPGNCPGRRDGRLASIVARTTTTGGAEPSTPLSRTNGPTTETARAPAASGPAASAMASDTSGNWTSSAFPTYLQARQGQENCESLSTPELRDLKKKYLGSDLPKVYNHNSGCAPDDSDCVWDTVRAEAQRDADEEPLLRSFLYASVLSHGSFEAALAFVMANRLASPTLLNTQLIDIFMAALLGGSAEAVAARAAARADLQAVRARDPACTSMAHAMLYYKGYHALQTYRVAHFLWVGGRRTLALTLQSRMSEVFAVDIHPAARIGKGVLLDHGTGVVIGETAVVGDRVSLMQGVTLGGTGKESGDRHPKVGAGVLISANATILGNIAIGEGSMVGAGSLVLKPVAPHTMCAGIPAKDVGKIVWTVEPAEVMAQNYTKPPPDFCAEWETAVRAALGAISPAGVAQPDGELSDGPGVAEYASANVGSNGHGNGNGHGGGFGADASDIDYYL